jgi:hypothetical protein
LAFASIEPFQIVVAARRHIAKVPGRSRREPTAE